LIEASAAGRPVVATDVGGVRSVVRHEVTGLLTPPGDDQALASAVARLVADGPTRTRMGLAGREHVKDRFGHGRMVTEMRCLYDDLLPRTRCGTAAPPYE
jgi:glycosyltransferase involved in cell wall biosynthesis